MICSSFDQTRKIYKETCLIEEFHQILFAMNPPQITVNLWKFCNKVVALSCGLFKILDNFVEAFDKFLKCIIQSRIKFSGIEVQLCTKCPVIMFRKKRHYGYIRIFEIFLRMCLFWRENIEIFDELIHRQILIHFKNSNFGTIQEATGPRSECKAL